MAARLGVSSRWLKEQAEAGSVPGLKAGERWLFKPDVVAAAVSKMAAWSVESAWSEVFQRRVNAIETRNLMNAVDGHSIVPPDELLRLGLPEDVCDRLTKTFRSNRNTPGGMIYVAGEPVAELRGVLGLDVLEWLANTIRADISGVVASGRGTRAEQFKAAILAVIGGDE
jgi:hypothetical protein